MVRAVCFSLSGKGLLDSFESFSINVRDESSSKYSEFLHGVFKRPGFKATYRQYGDIVLFEKDGFSSLPLVIKRFSFALHPIKHFFSPCSHSGVSQYTCGPGIQKGSYSNFLNIPIIKKIVIPRFNSIWCRNKNINHNL